MRTSQFSVLLFTLFCGLTLLIGLPVSVFAQSIRLVDGRKTPYCGSCSELIAGRSKEIQYGVDINSDGKVYFSVSNIEWFNKVCETATDGIAIELISKDQFSCSSEPVSKIMGSGYTLPIVYKPTLDKNKSATGNSHFTFFIGEVPDKLRGKELEGNVAFIKNGVVCYYDFQLDIPRFGWKYLPMGLFADSFLRSAEVTIDSIPGTLLYTKKLQFSISFSKNNAAIRQEDFQRLYDSLGLQRHVVTHIQIRSFSSIEGEKETNTRLQKERARSIINMFKRKQRLIPSTEIQNGENWTEFYKDCEKSAFREWTKMSTTEIKSRLKDKSTSDSLEQILQHHRKAIVTIYLDPKTLYYDDKKDSLADRFRRAIKNKDLASAHGVQKEVLDRIVDKSLPLEYLGKLEVPEEKYFGDLLISRNTLLYKSGYIAEQQALEAFENIYRIDSTNEKAVYNICALKLIIWQYDTVSIRAEALSSLIDRLVKSAIPFSLIRRMQLNFRIRMSELQMVQHQYAQKDETINYIVKNYPEAVLDDRELYSLAVYLSYYARWEDAERMIESRAQLMDADEDLLFYYLNLKLFNTTDQNDQLTPVILNAISMNANRFCRLFNSINNGGASFQLLSSPFWKKIYCQYCSIPSRKG